MKEKLNELIYWSYATVGLLFTILYTVLIVVPTAILYYSVNTIPFKKN